jgi:DNA topoisomerase-2
MFMDQRTHILRRPGIYIGSTDQIPRQKELYDLKNKIKYNEVISFPEGAEQIFLEILDNAVDAILIQKEGKIDIVIDNNKVSIINYDCIIPIEIHQTSGLYIPEVCFGTFNVSGNYNTLGNGQRRHNGLGSKAANIYSKIFDVVICDHNKQLKYSQKWSDNMINCEQPIIEKYLDDISFVKVSYQMDFEFFGYHTPGGGIYSSEALSLFAKHALNKSIEHQIPITFNGYELNL